MKQIPKNSKSITQFQKIVDLKNITKTFELTGQKIPVLKDISLSLNYGEFAAIVGPSGNGKSTLLNMMTGIDRPSSGDVIVNHQNLKDLSEDQLSGWRGKNLGIVFQFFQLLPALSLLQNVILPMDFVRQYSPKERRERAEFLLNMVGLEDQMHKLPGLVSGGQQQRAAIARALANDPPLIVADEPTGNLDVKTSEDVFSLFLDLSNQGKTVVMVTHNEDLACRANRRIEVINGLIAFDGSCS
ncbi:MAG: ABC transporter ATP-binding protein [Anaerolineaceae bacterium]|nr:ABC transporter ATP-binding protein [Anaerolineaceae bacterium]